MKWDIVGDPKVSILIPNKDHTDDLEKCLHSIWTKTSWENLRSSSSRTTPPTRRPLPIIRKPGSATTACRWSTTRRRLQLFRHQQLWSAVRQRGLPAAAEHDVEVRNADWLTELLRQCAHPGGAAICGAELLYPDETLQHAGVVTGLGGYAGHSHKYRKAGGSGYMFRAATVQDFSAVTGACLLVKTSVWDEVGGLDEAFAVAFNDVDFCLRVRDAGYRIAWTPYAQLTHYESKSRGGDEKTR